MTLAFYQLNSSSRTSSTLPDIEATSAKDETKEKNKNKHGIHSDKRPLNSVHPFKTLYCEQY